MDEIFVRLLAMPSTVRAMTVLDCDGNYNVYVNQQLPAEMQSRALAHEMRHIEAGHFYDPGLSIGQIEDWEL